MPIRKNRKYEAEKEERKREAEEDVGEVGEVDEEAEEDLNEEAEEDLNEEAVVGNDNFTEASPAFRGDLDETLAEAGDEWQKEVANGGGDRL